jgi:hypothetical protein
MIRSAYEFSSTCESDPNDRLDPARLDVAEAIAFNVLTVKTSDTLYYMRFDPSVSLKPKVIPKRPSNTLASTVNSYDSITGYTSSRHLENSSLMIVLVDP